MNRLLILPVLLLTLLVGNPAFSADYQKGLTAYESGDYATALREWTPLAEQGYADAQSNLGAMYEKGLGVPQDFKTAVKWYTLAAEQGYASAQSNLGLMYAKGQGVIQDYVRAHMWFNIAASSGHENITENVSVRRMGGVFIGFNKNAVTNRDIVAKRMTPADISAAQKLARECVRKKYKGC
jgi:TPR repeat protein